MADFKSRSLMRRLLLVVVVLATALLAVPTKASAEIILDDFDEPFEIVLPDMQDQYVVQYGIGPLAVERWSNVVATSGSNPTGRVDAGLSQKSALTVEIGRLNPHPIGGPPAVGVNLLYFFEEMDITQGGLNDRVVVDFGYLRSEIPLRRVTIFVQEASNPGTSYGAELFDVMTQDGRFALEFPFESLRGIRGGGSAPINFQRVYRMSLSISPTRFDDIQELNFSTAVDRIRFTSSVPEPNPCSLACFAGVAVISNCFHGRRTA